MNLDLTFSIQIFNYWVKITFIEIDIDKIWGMCFGFFRLSYSKEMDADSKERSLFLYNKTKYHTRLDICFIKVLEIYK